MANVIKNYWQEEDAMDDLVIKIIVIVVGIIAAMGIAWVVWNQIGKKADTATEEINDGSNPGAGHEFDGNPFGN